MTEAEPQPSRRSLWKYALIVAGVVFLSLLGVAWYLTSGSFQAMVRGRLVRELERVTGGRVEVGSVHTKPFLLEVEVRDLNIRVRELAENSRSVHVDRVIAKVKIVSVLGAELGFRSIVLERPVVHISVSPKMIDTQTPHVQQGRGPTEVPLFGLSVGRLDVRKGELLWGDHAVPLDFTADDVSADLRHSVMAGRYQGNLLIGKGNAKLEQMRPVGWMGEAHFSLGPNDLDLRSLHLNSGHSHVEASGKINDFQRPRIELSYKASMDLWEVAMVTRDPDLRKGRLLAEGNSSWSDDGYSSRGKFSVTDFEGTRNGVMLRDASLSGEYVVSPEKFVLSKIQAKLFNGTVSGEAEVANWLGLVRPLQTAKTVPAKEQRGSLKLSFKGVSVGELLVAFSPKGHPITRMGLAGDTGGTANVTWVGAAKNAEVEAALEVVPPTMKKAGQLPLTAVIRALYHGKTDSLDLRELSAQTPGTDIKATGRLSSNAALKFSISTRDLNEWRQVLAMTGHNQAVPADLHGTASLSGTASGKFSDPIIAGDLLVENFDLRVASLQGGREQQLSWDSLATFVELSQHHIVCHHAVLHHGNADFKFDLSLGLERGEFTDHSPLALRLEGHNANPAKLMALLGEDLPVSGDMDVNLRAWGTKTNPGGQGRILLKKGSLYGQQLDQFSAELRLADQQLILNNLQLRYGKGTAGGSFSYALSSGAIHFDLSGKGFDLAQIQPAQIKNLPVGGLLDFAAQGSGTREAPIIQAQLHLRDLKFGAERAGDYSIVARTEGEMLRFTGRSEFGQATLASDGVIRLRENWPADITLKFTGLAADPLLAPYLAGRITGHSSMDGALRIQGPLRDMTKLEVAGDLGQLVLDSENIRLNNQGPVRFSVSNQVLKIDQFHLVGERTDFTASGMVPLRGDRQVQLQADGRVNLRLLERFNPNFTSSGVVSVKANITGTVSQPAIQGRMDISRGSIAYIDLPSALSEINGSILFNQDRAEVEGLTARVGGGSVVLKGQATFYNRQLHFDLGLHGQEVRLRYPPGVSSTADLDVRFAGTPAGSTLSGDVTITKLSMTPGFDFGAYLQRTTQGQALSQTDPILSRIRLDLHILTTPELQMRTAAVHLSGDADLRVRGTAAKPSLLGRADVLEGEVYFNGTKYRLERGDVTFLPAGPVVDLQATTRVRDYDITLSVNGPADKLNLTYRSEPPLPSADIISLLALGRTRQESAQLQQANQSPFGGEAGNVILNEALNAAVSNRVQRLFGGSRIKIDPEGLTTETSTLARGPAVRIEQQVAGDLTLTYTTNVSQASQQIIQAEYNVSRNVSIVAVRDQNGVVSFDVRIRRRKK